MTSDESSGFYKILHLDRRILYLFVIGLVVLALIAPVGLPIKIDKMTMEYYNAIESLPPGAFVLYEVDVQAGTWGDQGPGIIATTNHLFEKDIKFIIISFLSADANTIFQTMVEPNVDKGNKKYGVDWVNIGYLEGKEVAMSAFAKDFTFPQKDIYGNSIVDLPIFNQIKSMNDINLIVAFSSGMISEIIRQFSVPYSKSTIFAATTMMIPGIMPYYPSIVKGIQSGLPGAAQYESILQKPGLGIKSMDALSFVHIFLLALIVLVNIIYVMNKKRGGSKI